MNKDSAVYKMFLLAMVCTVCGLLLSVVNQVTAPIIAENSLAVIKASLEEIYPGGSFKDVTEDYIKQDETGLIDGIYEAEGQGYIFTLHGTGYSSNGFTFMVGFDNDGKISGYKSLEHSETSGIGSRALEDGGDYQKQILDLTSADPIPLLSGATLTSTAVQKGIDAAKAVFNNMQGISYDPNATAEADTSETSEADGAKTLADEKFTKNEAACEVADNIGSRASFNCSAKGYEGVNEATVVIEDGKVIEVTVTAFNDTEGVGDAAVSEAALESFKGVDLSSSVDVTSGASNTSKSIKAMVQKALLIYSGSEGESSAETTGEAAETPALVISDEEVLNSIACVVFDNTTAAVTYKCTAATEGGEMESTITIEDGAVKEIAMPGAPDADLEKVKGMTSETATDADLLSAMAKKALAMAVGE